jgi:hypothetical protein
LNKTKQELEGLKEKQKAISQTTSSQEEEENGEQEVFVCKWYLDFWRWCGEELVDREVSWLCVIRLVSRNSPSSGRN